MATVKRGQLTAIKEWIRHLRDQKRGFWKAERKAAKAAAKNEAKEHAP